MRWEMLAAGVLLIAMACVDVMRRRTIARLESLLCELVKAMADQALAEVKRSEWPIDLAVLPDCDCPACAKGRERRN